MNRVQIFVSSNPNILEKDINDWLAHNDENIESVGNIAAVANPNNSTIEDITVMVIVPYALSNKGRYKLEEETKT